MTALEHVFPDSKLCRYDFGIWVHANKIELLKRDYTKKIYNKYDSLYSDKDLRKYIVD